MRYLGGKSRIAGELVEQMAPAHYARVWEPFCGGANVSLALAWQGAKKLVCSDSHQALITLYQAVMAGWQPPRMTAEGYELARALSDDDPIKAFAGYGCSFGGKWFGGLARDERRDYGEESARALARLRAHSVLEFERYDFLEEPADRELAKGLLIYCDPPYRDTTGYAGVPAFDHELFWRRCFDWAHSGAAVFVSEFAAPELDGIAEVWQKERANQVGENKRTVTERLFQVHAYRELAPTAIAIQNKDHARS